MNPLRMWTLVVVVLLCCGASVSAIYLDECNEALGMESGKIKNEDINASSSYILASVGPQNARLNKDLIGGAWCPKPQIAKDVQEFLEINLGSLTVVSAVATQGRFGNGQGLEFAEEYMIEYWRPGLGKFVRYKSDMGQEILKGNSNTYTVVQRKLSPIVIASKIRFIPFSVHLRTICMRVEVYGCPYNEGLLSYSMPQGERRGVEVDLSDHAYDGWRSDDGLLKEGLGQLTDGVVGADNFKQDVSGKGRGYEWVGWKNETGGSVTLLFEFDGVRNFTSALFHCNNMHSREVRVFGSARLWLSVGGRHFPGPPLNFSYMPDPFFENARNVTVHLYHRVGRFLKVELAFAAKWMLLSEVSFVSVPAVGNFTEEEPPAAPPIVSTALSEDTLSQQYVGLVIGVLAAVILLLVVVIFVIVARNRRRKHATPHAILKPLDNTVTINMKDLGLTYSSCSPLAPNGSIYGHQVILDDVDPDKLLYQEPQDFKISYNGSYSNDSTTSREYAVPDLVANKSTSTAPGSKQPVFPRTLPKPPERFYAATDVLRMSPLYTHLNQPLQSQQDLLAGHKVTYGSEIKDGQDSIDHRLRIIKNQMDNNTALADSPFVWER